MADLLERIRGIYSKYGVPDLDPKFVLIGNDCRDCKNQGAIVI